MSDLLGRKLSCNADLCSSGAPGGAACPPSEYADEYSDYQYCPALETGIACTATGVYPTQSFSHTLYLAIHSNVYLGKGGDSVSHTCPQYRVPLHKWRCIIFVSLPCFITPHVFICPVLHYHRCVYMQSISHELYPIYLTRIPMSFTSRTAFMPHVAAQHFCLMVSALDFLLAQVHLSYAC